MDQTMKKSCGCNRSIQRNRKSNRCKACIKRNNSVINYNGSRERAEEVKNEVESAGGKAGSYNVM